MLRWRLVEEQPEPADKSYGLGELTGLDGLADVAVGSEVVGAAQIVLIDRGGEDDYGKTGSAGRRGCPEHVEPADLGQVQIEQDERRPVCTS